MTSPSPSEIESRVEYFESWLLDQSTQEEREKVTDKSSAKDFIKEVFNKDTSLSNLLDGMEKAPSTFDTLIKGTFVQELIKGNTGEKPIFAPKKINEYKLTRSNSISQLIPKENKALRLKIIKAIYNDRVPEKTGFRYETNKRGVTVYRNLKNGRFTSSGNMLKAGDKYVKANPNKRAEIERLMRLELSK